MGRHQHRRPESSRPARGRPRRDTHHVSSDLRSLSDESVYGVGQDAEGTIWVGTQNGLQPTASIQTVADSRAFSTIAASSPRIGDNWVLALPRGTSARSGLAPSAAASTAGMRAATSSGISRWRSSRAATPSSTTYSRFTRGSDGRVWAGTRRGLVTLDPEQDSATPVDMSNGTGIQPLISAMHADHKGRLWVATIAQGVLIVDMASGRWTPAPQQHRGAGESVRRSRNFSSRPMATRCSSAPGAAVFSRRRSRNRTFACWRRRLTAAACAGKTSPRARRTARGSALGRKFRRRSAARRRRCGLRGAERRRRR